jgi:hypothetical protein
MCHVGHWKLNSWSQVLQTLLGMALHGNTDNAAYDMTLHSQLAWADHLPTISSTYYLSIAGVSYRQCSSYAHIGYTLLRYLVRREPKSSAGFVTGHWADQGFDGLLTTTTQLYPQLGTLLHPHEDVAMLPNNAQPGRWYVLRMELDHLGSHPESRQTAWRHAIQACATFQQQFKLNKRVQSRASIRGADSLGGLDCIDTRSCACSQSTPPHDADCNAYSCSVGKSGDRPDIQKLRSDLFLPNMQSFHLSPSARCIVAMLSVLFLYLTHQAISTALDAVITMGFSIASLRGVFVGICGLSGDSAEWLLNLLRIGLLLSRQSHHQRFLSIYSHSLLLESLYQAIYGGNTEFHVAEHKAALACLLSSPKTLSLLSHQLITILLPIEGTLIVSSCAWKIATLQVHYQAQHISTQLWWLAWLCFAVTSLLGLYAVYYMLLQVSLSIAAVLLVMFFHRMRLMSHAYQLSMFWRKYHCVRGDLG